jgi:beta-lactamase superfamily II metal-dependent hydrolase
MPTITVFAAGAGDSVLVQDLQGRSILIDTGSVARTTLAQLGGTLPFWQRRIDAVTLLGFEAGHAGALPEIASRYTLNAAVAPKAPSKPGTSDQTAEAALPANSLRIAPTDSILDKADRIPATGVSVELWSAGTAATPHVLARITADDATILDAASLSPTDQHRLLLEDVPLQASVLIAPGGATAAAFDPGFLLAVHPSYILAGAPPARASTAAPATDPYVYDPDVTVVRVDLSGPLQLVPEGDSFVLQ